MERLLPDVEGILGEVLEVSWFFLGVPVASLSRLPLPRFSRREIVKEVIGSGKSMKRKTD